MNQISLYNKSTDSKLSIEAEELTRSRNIKIPKDGSFLLTNKTRLTEELKDKYTVGPNGDFQELEEAVRVLCNMKQYSNGPNGHHLQSVEVELQENYIFKPYNQCGMDASFIKVTSKSIIDVPVFNPYESSLFNLSNGAISPIFDRLTMSVRVSNCRLATVTTNSCLKITNSTIGILYQDTLVPPMNFPIYAVYDYGMLDLFGVVINMSINKHNNTMLNNGEPIYRWLSLCGEHSDTLLRECKLNISDHSNMNDDSGCSVLPSGYNSRMMFIGSGSLVDYSTEHGFFHLFTTHGNGCLTMTGGVTLTANSNTRNRLSTLIFTYNLGSVTCRDIKLLNCGRPGDPMNEAFTIDTASVIHVRDYKNTNSYFINETNITVNTLTTNGVIYK